MDTSELFVADTDTQILKDMYPAFSKRIRSLKTIFFNFWKCWIVLDTHRPLSKLAWNWYFSVAHIALL